MTYKRGGNIMAVMNVTYMSAILRRYVDVKVILPIEDTKMLDPALVKKPEKFKTLYLLHGYSGDSSAWLYGSRIFKLARDRNLAVVMPSGENSFYIDREDVQVMYGRFIAKELVDITRKMFPLSSLKEDTFIGGLSMGGYGSLLIGSKYNDVFGGIITLSGPVLLPDLPFEKQLIANLNPSLTKGYFEHIFGNLDGIIGSENDALFMVLKAHAEQKLPRLYIACGTEDYVYENVITYVNILKKNHVAFTFEEGTGAHEWTFWDSYIEKGIDWYLR